MSRIIVTGCRDWTDRDAVFRELDALVPARPFITVVHGACQDKEGMLCGADRFANEWAWNRDARSDPHPADWNTHGKAAGPIRNREMAELGAYLCVAFWDGRSPGTRDMIEQAVRAGIPVRIVPAVKP